MTHDLFLGSTAQEFLTVIAVLLSMLVLIKIEYTKGKKSTHSIETKTPETKALVG